MNSVWCNTQIKTQNTLTFLRNVIFKEHDVQSKTLQKSGVLTVQECLTITTNSGKKNVYSCNMSFKAYKNAPGLFLPIFQPVTSHQDPTMGGTYKIGLYQYFTMWKQKFFGMVASLNMHLKAERQSLCFSEVDTVGSTYMMVCIQVEVMTVQVGPA